MAENGNWLVEVKPWYVVGNTDDNPHMTKYTGYYQLKFGYHLVMRCQCERTVQLEHRLRRRGVRCNLPDHQTCAPLYEFYSGYGESLIDYSFNQTRVGVGVMLNDLF
ncbi:phospholipase A [Escherichia coli]